MNQDEPKTGLDAFNEVPSWYTEPTPTPSQQMNAMPPPPPGAPKSPLASAQPSRGGNTGGQRAMSSAPASNNGGGGSGAGGLVVGLLMKFGLFGLLAGGGWFLTLGTTAAQSLETGDCFVMPTELEIERVDSTSCSDTHDAQVIGHVTVNGPAEYPGFNDPYWITVLDQCEDLALSTMTNIDLLPFDAQIEIFTPLEPEWNQGERESVCNVWSPTGLNGSHLVGS